MKLWGYVTIGPSIYSECDEMSVQLKGGNHV